MLSPPLAAKSAQHFLYTLGFLPPYPAHAKCLLSTSLPCLVQSYSILSKHLSSWSQSQASCLEDGLSSAHAQCVCREMKEYFPFAAIYSYCPHTQHRLSIAFLQLFANQSNILQYFLYTAHFCYNRNFTGRGQLEQLL